jgi:diketogulonate reductase-like aldo/keto reductase
MGEYSLNKRYTLKNGYSFSRIINGGWQLSEGHALKSEIERKDVVKAFHELVARGFTTFDCADIYTGVEEFYGSFLKEHLAAGGHREDLQFHSKFVPDRAGLHRIADQLPGAETEEHPGNHPPDPQAPGS